MLVASNIQLVMLNRIEIRFLFFLVILASLLRQVILLSCRFLNLKEQFHKFQLFFRKYL